MSAARHILCFDLGTTNFKAALIDDDGRTVALARIPCPVHRSLPGRAELSIDEFEGVIADLAAHVARDTEGVLSDVRAVTFATQANSFLLLDRHDEPLTPLILWPDDRARDDVEPMNQLDSLRRITGVPRLDFEFMPAKLRWLRRHAPATWRKTHRICGIGDYLTMCLSGEYVVEAGAAALTGLDNAQSSQWWRPALDTVKLPSEWLPRLVRAGTDVGPIRAAAAERLGLPVTARVVVGCLDQYAGAIGLGGVDSERFCETTGTVLAAVCVANEWRNDLPIRVFQGPAFDEEHYFRMEFSATSTNLLDFYLTRLAEPMSVQQLDLLVAQEYMTKNRVDIPSIESAGSIDRCFVNVDVSHAPAKVALAIMERIAPGFIEQQLLRAEDGHHS